MGASASLEQRQAEAMVGQHQTEQNPTCSSSYEASPCSNGVRHIRIQRRFMGIEPFYHHGVDLGDGHVAHYCKQHSFEPARVRITTWDRFVRDGIGHDAEEIEHSCSIPADKVRQRIARLYGRKEYNLLFCNCEHFASFCVCGTFRSSQVEEVMEGFGAIHRALGIQATSILFSGTHGGPEAPFLHSKPTLTQMAAVSALDMAASGVKLALETVHRYTLRQAGAFEDAVASPERSGSCGAHSDACVCAVSPASTCPCCARTSGQLEGSSRSSTPQSSWWPAQLDPATVLYTALCAGIDGITWLTSSASNPSRNAQFSEGDNDTGPQLDRAGIYELDDSHLTDESPIAA